MQNKAHLSSIKSEHEISQYISPQVLTPSTALFQTECIQLGLLTQHPQAKQQWLEDIKYKLQIHATFQCKPLRETDLLIRHTSMYVRAQNSKQPSQKSIAQLMRFDPTLHCLSTHDLPDYPRCL